MARISQGLPALALGLAALLAGTSADARDLRYATGFGPGSVGHSVNVDFAKGIAEKTGGELTVSVFPQSLLSFPEMSDGVRDGIADIGWLVPPYYPALYPSINMIGEMTMIWAQEEADGRAPLAWTGALIEYVTSHCPGCEKEFAAQNQVYITGSSSEYLLLCVKPVTVPADLVGTRVRASSAHWARWLVHNQALSVSLPLNETFEGMSQGILDCALSHPQDLIDFSLIDVVKHITLGAPGGGFGSTAQQMVNQDVWRSLSRDERIALMQGGAEQGASMAWQYFELYNQALDKARARGIQIIEADEALRQGTADFTASDIAALAELNVTRYGLTDAAASVEKMRELFAKWNGLVKNVASADELSALYWSEALSKVDPDTYGM